MICRIILVILSVIVVIGGLFVWSLFSVVEFGIGTPQEQQKLLYVQVPTASFITVRPEAQPLIKKTVQKVEDILYRQATLHNPVGDLLPDEIDNNIKELIKETIQ